MDEFNCDIANVLQNRDFGVLEKLVSYCYNIRTKIAAKVEDVTAYEIECMGKRTQSVSKISELQRQAEHLKSEIDGIKLQQKIVDKKVKNAVEQRERLKEDVEEAKLRRDSLSLEMVDLQQEAEKRKEQKILAWNAIKMACHSYKQHLDFRIHLIDNKDHEQIEVSFFISDDRIKDGFFVHLLNVNDKWRVDLIEPKLKAEHLEDLKGIVDFSKQSEISNVTAFLCKLRFVFVKHYLNTKRK